MNKATFEYMETYFDELEPQEFYRRLFGSGNLSADENAAEYALHATIMNYAEGAAERHIKVWDDLAAIHEVQGDEHRAMAMPPVAYIGTRRKNENARLLFALTIDLDYLTEYGTANLFSQIERAEVLPRPTFTVCSGNGLHLYYQFDRPIPCYEYNRKKIGQFKAGLTRKIWNAYITEHWKKPEIESAFQCMRVVGSGTKDGGIVRAFETGDTVTTDYLDSFVAAEYQIGNLESRDGSGMPLTFWRLHDPKWYNERVQDKRPRKYWTCHRGLYDNWLQRIKTEASVNHRYFAVMALAIYAIKSAVPFAELERDALSLIPILDALTEEENNHFTEKDVRSALRAYSERYKTFPRYWIEQLCAIAIPANRRNGRTREEHLEIMRAIKAIHKRNGTLNEGRPSKSAAVQEWRQNNPEGSKAECRRETGLAWDTIRKHWQQDEPQRTERDLPTIDDVISFSDVQSLADVNRQIETLQGFLDTLTAAEQKAWYEQNRETVDELMSLLEEYTQKK